MVLQKQLEKQYVSSMRQCDLIDWGEIMLRDKFAMAAMQGLLSDSEVNASCDRIAKSAYDHADAMMKERANWDFSGDPDNVSVKVVGSKRPVPPEVETPPIKYE